MGRLTLLALAACLGLTVAGCGGGGEKKSEESTLGKEAQAACTGSALSEAPTVSAFGDQISAPAEPASPEAR